MIRPGWRDWRHRKFGDYAHDRAENWKRTPGMPRRHGWQMIGDTRARTAIGCDIPGHREVYVFGFAWGHDGCVDSWPS